MFSRTLRVLTFHLFTLFLLCWVGGAWAATSGDMIFSSSDTNPDYTYTTITKIVGTQTFSVSGGGGSGGLAFDAGGIYANEGPASEVKLTITAPSSYLFNLDSLLAQAQTGSFQIQFTRADGTTGNTTVNGVQTSGTLSSPSYLHNVNLANLTQVVLSSTEYAAFNNFALSNIKPIPALPTVTTDAASSITSTGATFNGTVNAQGDSTVVAFDFGTTTGYGASVAALQSPVTGSSGTAVSNTVFFLSCNTTYHYRVVATNATGTTTGGDQSLTTSACPPAASSLSPSGGPAVGGTSVTITGTDFTGATAVAFGATPAASFTVDSATQITAAAPAGTAGNVYVTVTTAAGTSATGVGNQYTYVALPVVSSLSPTLGTTAGGTSVTITGTGFSGASAVSFGATAAASYTVNSATQITATAPAGGQGTVDVSVTTVGGTSATGASTRFTYAAAPTATTSVASSITATGATIPGTANDNGAATTLSFEYGLNTSYGSTATATPTTLSAGAGNTAVSGSLSGLSCNTTYHYRLKAVNGIATTNGLDASFTTAACSAPDAPTIGTATAGNAQATVTFTPPASDGGSTITGYTATSNPGGLTGTCASSPCTVTGLTNGTAYTFTVTATNGVGTGAASAASNSVTPRASQTITFGNPGDQSFGTTPTLTATASSNLTPTFSSSTTGVCTITSGGVLTFVTAGSCTINADQAGDASYLPAMQVSQTFTVNPAVPGAPTIGTATAGDTQASVSFTAPTNTGGTAITGYTVTSSPPGGTDSNAGGTGLSHVITGLTNGTAYTFTVTASNSAGTGPASAASNSVTPTTSQTITFANPGAQNVGTSPTLTASSDSGLTVSFTSSTTGVCTITTGGVLTFVTAGSCTINADQAGNASYLPATQVSRTFTVNPVVPGAPTGVSATAGNTQASVSFTAPASNGGAAISGYTVTSSPGGVTGTGAASPIAVTGLTNGVTYTFTVTATNSEGTGAVSAASSGVTPADAPPVASAVSATVAYGSSNNAITLALSGSTATSVAVASAPAHGTATASGTSISYTPSPTYSGSDSFTYTATNAGGTSIPATVTITVNPQAPVAGNVSLNVDVNSSNNVVPLNLSGGAAASVAVVTAPSHGVATVSGTSISYTPTSGYIGADSFTYTATNVTGTSAPGTVTLLVQSRPDPTKDAEVTGLINAQVEVANRFAQAQISNFQSHLEGMHQRSRGAGSATRSFVTRTGSSDPWGDATDDTSVVTGPTESARVIGGKPYGVKRVASSSQNGSDSGTVAYGRFGAVSTSTGLDEFVLPQTKSNTDSQSLSSLLPWSFTSLNLGGKHGDILGNGLEVWTAGVVSIGKTSDTDTRFTTSGISIGADQRIDEGLMIGVGAGFGHERQKIGDNGTKNDGDGYSFVVYGSYQPIEAIFLDGLLGYGSLDFDADRYVSALGSKAGSSRRGTQWFASLSGGYDFVEGKSLLSTYGRLDWISTRLNESTETGGGIYSLTYFEQSTSTNKLSVGVRGETQVEWSNGSARPYFRIEFQHNLDTPGTAEMAYADQLFKVYEFDIEGVDRNTLVLGLGGDVLFKKDWNLGLGYRYSYGSESTRTHALRFELKKAF